MENLKDMDMEPFDKDKTLAETVGLMEDCDLTHKLPPDDSNYIRGYLDFVCEELKKPEPDYHGLIARAEAAQKVLDKYLRPDRAGN